MGGGHSCPLLLQLFVVSYLLFVPLGRTLHVNSKSKAADRSVRPAHETYFFFNRKYAAVSPTM